MTYEGFDMALSISSFDHDGLGRYGDPLDPVGDLKAMRTFFFHLRVSSQALHTVLSRMAVCFSCRSLSARTWWRSIYTADMAP